MNKLNMLYLFHKTSVHIGTLETYRERNVAESNPRQLLDRVSHRQKRRRQKKTTDVCSLDTVPCTACGTQFCADTSGLKWIQCQICNNCICLAKD